LPESARIDIGITKDLPCSKTMANFVLARSMDDVQSNAATRGKKQPFDARFTFKDIGVGLEDYLRHEKIATLCEGGRRFKLIVEKCE
jgi:hypothetical protein